MRRAAAADAPDPAPIDGLVIDDSGLLAPSTRRYLNKLVAQLELQTGVKVRVICPPLGLQQGQEQLAEFMRPLAKSLSLDSSSVVIVAEQMAEARTGRPMRLLRMKMGSAVQQRFQYTFNNDFIASVANRFGSPGYVNARGADAAVRDATENVVAALYSLADRESEDRQSRSLFTKPWYRSYVPADDVSAILGRHAA